MRPDCRINKTQTARKDWHFFKHGLVKSSEFQSWMNMKRRCSEPTHNRYKFYGGKGIKVCDRWLQSFENFYEDMGSKPKGTSLDRINNDGNYELSNCRWASFKTQMRNTSRNALHTSEGITKTLVEWSEDSKVNYKTFHARIAKLKWTIKKSIDTPPRKRRTL